ncbi:MAG: endonuclease/exonuclease/phosphatase family protein [Bacteroidota bacterium]
MHRFLLILANTFLLLVCSIPSQLQAQRSLKIMHYNLLRYGDQDCGPTFTQKDGWLSTILEASRPDVMTVNEILPSEAFSNRVRGLGFTYTDQIEYGELTNEAGGIFVNNIFYRRDKLGYVGVEVIEASPRDVNVYTLFDRESVGTRDTLFLYFIVGHLKASDSSSDRAQRSQATTNIIDWMDRKGRGRHVILSGDFNFSSASEAAFQNLVKQTDQEIDFYDPAGKENNWNGPTHTLVHTQSPRTVSPDCGVAGGLDDRFDIILLSNAIRRESRGVFYQEGSYEVFGNGGDSYDRELRCSSDGPVSTTVCAALKQFSDHLPVTIELGLPILSTSISDQISQASIYVQNPVQDKLTIRWGNSQVKEIRVINSIGQVMGQMDISLTQAKAELSTLNWPIGVYWALVSDKQGKSRAFKLLKQ